MSIDFKIDESLCIGCKKCVADCPVNIIGFDKIPFIKDESHCLKCQHCLAVCPTGALSILGKDPKNSISADMINLDSSELEKFIKFRRTVRKFKDNELSEETLNKLIEATSYAPSGHNSKKTFLTITASKLETDNFLAFMMREFEIYLKSNTLPDAHSFLKYVHYQYKKKGDDVTFRGAPHIIVTSIPKGLTISYVDTIIALSYFEIYANSLGVGTVWSGIGRYFFEILPNLKDYLKIPEENSIGYVMAFGIPDVRYYRTVQHEKLNHKILGLK
ncbi:MAG: nitroreductase [Deferribacteraceae bacterium]|jgi:nitroreductase/NAD-dependent dihydropyrimidine dehydrogenase PreA subunit|nr:nitroreductase [Deferribacteraceae bacterium]